MTDKEKALGEYGHLVLPDFFTLERILSETGNKNVAGRMRAVVSPKNGNIRPFSLCSQCRGIVTVEDLIKFLENGEKLHKLPGIGKKTANVFIRILDNNSLL